jgi:microcystin-dependent protein
MASPFVAEVRIFACNFAPTGWATCDGQLLPISQNTALFSLLGTTYGGDGESTFGLPNLQGSAAMHPGQGPGLSPHDLGETAGEQTVTLLQNEMPSHAHVMQGTAGIANQNNPGGFLLGRPFGGGSMYKAPSGAVTAQLALQAIAPAGGGMPHNNMQPYLTVLFAIALQGIFPSRG